MDYCGDRCNHVFVVIGGDRGIRGLLRALKGGGLLQYGEKDLLRGRCAMRASGGSSPKHPADHPGLPIQTEAVTITSARLLVQCSLPRRRPYTDPAARRRPYAGQTPRRKAAPLSENRFGVGGP